MKKLLTLIFISVFCLNAINAEVTWTLSDDGTLTISGTDMPNYSSTSTPWSSQAKKIKKIIIENGVKNIGDDAFNCIRTKYAYTSVSIPESVTKIGKYAFFDSNLTSIVIPNSVKSIGECAFKACSLTSLTIGKSVTSIGDEAFYECSILTSIIVDKNNKVYDSREDCNAIIKTATNELILGCSNTVIPNSVTSIGESAFAYCSDLTSIEIPNSVTKIGYQAFFYCWSLRSVTIPNSVTSIEYQAFYECPIKEVKIPASVKSLGTKVFTAGTIIIEMNPVTVHVVDAFRRCTYVIIGDSVTSIGNRAFHDSPNLRSVTFSNSVTSIGDEAFSGCQKLSSITIPNSVEKIGEKAFAGCAGLTSAKIGNSVTSIGNEAFQGCLGLTSVTIGSSVTSIGSAFFDCQNLTKVICKAVTPPSCTDHTFYYVRQNYPRILYVPASALSAYRASRMWRGLWSSIVPIEEPTSVLLANELDTLIVGKQKTLKATITPEDVTDNTITWTSSNTDIATVSTEGVVTAKSSGTVVITAKTDNGINAECTITVIQPVTSIALNATSAILKIGETKDLIATASPATADNTKVEWSSSNANVATVSSKGVVTAKGIGTCTITCTAIDGYGAKKICYVTVIQPVTSIALNATTASLRVGETKSLFATVSPTTANNTKVEWSSSDTKVATVSSKGVITAKGKGTCIITCTAADGYGTESTCSVTVIQPVTSIALNATIASLQIGETKNLVATVSPTTANNTKVEWSSSDTKVATVSSTGVVTAKGKGTCTITCTAIDGYGAKKTCSVTVIQPVTSIALNATTASLRVGETKNLTATVSPTTANNTKVEWSSSDTKVATVSSTGVLTAKGKGTCTIICTAADGYGTKSTCSVTVKQPVTAIILSDATASLWVGETKTITATVTPTSASDTAVKWSSSDTKVAIISSDGTITAIGTGSCTITCTAADGYGTKSTCKVTVKQQVNSIDFENETLTITCGTEKILNPTITPSNADVQTLAWKSTDKNIAEITSKGVLKAVSPGTATITCTSTDGFNKQGSIKVNVVSFDITDDKPNIADGTYGTGGITYTRAMKKDKCDVFCMPYDIDLSEYTDFFNKVYVLNGMAIHKSNGTVLIPLKEVTCTETISAGQPFVAYAATSGQVVLKNSSKITIASLEEPQAIKLDVYDYSGNSVTYNPNIDMTITGNYAKRTGLDKANTFVFSTSGLMSKATTVSPYRFYFTKNDERSSAKITDIQLSFDEDVTGIEELTITNDNKFIYNLKGQRINRADVQKGVYIINGKKKVIK